MNPSILDIVWY